MTISPAEQPLTLADALLRWADPALVERVRTEERRLLTYHVHDFYQVSDDRWRLCEEAELRQPRQDSWMEQAAYGRLVDAWLNLERDFRKRLECEDFHLTGVQSAPRRMTERELILGAWAADMQFRFASNAVQMRAIRYVGLQVFSGRPPAAATTGGHIAATEQAPANRTIPRITRENVRALSDDEVLLLLDEHARRVIAGPDAKLIAPGKISLLPLVAGKMRHRAAQGELLPTMSAEAALLADWIKSKVQLHQVPSAATISKSLATEYGVLKARSNAAIQKLNP